MQQKVLQNLTKYNTDTVKQHILKIYEFFIKKTSDLTNLKVNLDQRFAKLEKTIEKINSMTIRESEKGTSRYKVKSNCGDIDIDENNFTLSLNFDVRIPQNPQHLNEVSQWNKVNL